MGVPQEEALFLIGYLAISSLVGKLVTGKFAELPFVSPISLMIVSFFLLFYFYRLHLFLLDFHILE